MMDCGRDTAPHPASYGYLPSFSRCPGKCTGTWFGWSASELDGANGSLCSGSALLPTGRRDRERRFTPAQMVSYGMPGNEAAVLF